MLLGAIAELDWKFAHFRLLTVETKFHASRGVVIIGLQLRHVNAVDGD